MNLNINNIRELEKRFVELKTTDDTNKPILDGIVNLKQYLSAKLKILWILNDVNDLYEKGTIFENDDLREVLFKLKLSSKGAWRPMLDPIIYSSFGILNNFQAWNVISNTSAFQEPIDILKEIALINLKKIHSKDKNTTSGTEVYDGQHLEFVMKQIDAFKPDVIIVTSIIELFAKDIAATLIEKHPIRYAIKNNQLFIEAHHPHKRIEDLTQEEYCNSIINCVKEWKN